MGLLKFTVRRESETPPVKNRLMARIGESETIVRKEIGENKLHPAYFEVVHLPIDVHQWLQDQLFEAAERSTLRRTGWPIGVVLHKELRPQAARTFQEDSRDRIKARADPVVRHANLTGRRSLRARGSTLPESERPSDRADAKRHWSGSSPPSSRPFSSASRITPSSETQRPMRLLEHTESQLGPTRYLPIPCLLRLV